MDPAIRAIIGIARTGYQLRAAHRNLDGCRQAIARFVAEQLARELFAFLYHVLGICQLQAGRVKRDGIGFDCSRVDDDLWDIRKAGNLFVIHIWSYIQIGRIRFLE